MELGVAAKTRLQCRVEQVTGATGAVDGLEEAIDSQTVSVVDERDAHFPLEGAREMAWAHPQLTGEALACHRQIFIQGTQDALDERALTGLAGQGLPRHRAALGEIEHREQRAKYSGGCLLSLVNRASGQRGVVVHDAHDVAGCNEWSGHHPTFTDHRGAAARLTHIKGSLRPIHAEAPRQA
jgi:hypothetical protein